MENRLLPGEACAFALGFADSLTNSRWGSHSGCGGVSRRPFALDERAGWPPQTERQAGSLPHNN